jgi:hypothetical protein
MDTSSTSINTIDCACVIHGSVYDWQYVERLYAMLCRNLTAQPRLHVYTEAERPVPAHMIKHVLPAWGIHGARQSWWYKLCLFNASELAGPLLYFDLDTVIVNNIDWIVSLPTSWFWSVQDFKYLWRQHYHGINSSVMWWDTRRFDFVWQDFQNQNLQRTIKLHRGDQDYLTKTIPNSEIRFLDSTRVKSWRWQCIDGGYDFKRRAYRNPDSGSCVTSESSVLIFHGQPKPHQVQDPVVLQHWK